MKKQEGLTRAIIVIIIVSISMILAVIGIVYINSTSLQDNSNAQISNNIGTKATDAVITITESGFFPQTLAISKGQAVTWFNKDSKSHEITFSSRSLLGQSVFNIIIGPNESFTFSFEQEEIAMYRATINGQQITGQIIIK